FFQAEDGIRDRNVTGVQTCALPILRIMERKGHLTHRMEGREFVYRPRQPRGKAGRSAFERVLDVFFNGSLENAVAAHLSDPRREIGRASCRERVELRWQSGVLNDRV